MLNQGKVIGFVPTRDAVRARAFYVDLLGLPLISTDPFATVVEANGTHIRITNAGEFTPFPFTQLGWEVTEIVTVARDLAAKGVVFERFGFLEHDADAIWTAPGGDRVAWFRDPDGNILSISQH